MKISLSLATVSIVALACSACSDGITPSVSATTPLRAFTGRTLDVHLAGSGTHWDEGTTVSFGDKITVNKVTVASLTAIVANITVAPDAAVGPRDITVTQGGSTQPYLMAFSIESALEVTYTGTPAQGAPIFLTIENRDLEHLFDDTAVGGGLFSAPDYTNIVIKAPTGTSISVSSVTPFKVEATMLIDVTAKTGKFDLSLASGPIEGPTDPFSSPGLFDIAARTATPLANGASVTLAKATASELYEFTPSGADHLVTLSIESADSDASPSLILIDGSGSFMDIIDSGATITWFPKNTDKVYVVAYDAGATSASYSASVATSDLALTLQAGGEGDDTANNTSAGAITLGTAPVRVKGASLSSKTDADWYKIVVPAGKRIRAQTAPGDADTDTTVQFFGTDGTTALNAMAIDSNTHENVLSPALAGAGTYFIKIGASDQFDPGAKNYDLIVTFE